MSEYIGNVISIIDQNDDVYVGVLDKISAETSTVELVNVKLNPKKKNSQTLDHIKLNGADVKDLQVLDSNKEKTKSQSQSKPKPEQHNESEEENDNEVEEVDEDEDFYSRTQRLAKAAENDTSETGCAYDSKTSFFDELEPANNSYSGRGGRGRGRGRGRGFRGRGGRGGRNWNRARSEFQMFTPADESN